MIQSIVEHTQRSIQSMIHGCVAEYRRECRRKGIQLQEEEEEEEENGVGTKGERRRTRAL